MRIEITKWEKYNPRPRGDVKSASWYRQQNNFILDPDFFDYSNDQKMIWIFLCCEASKKMSGCIDINQDLISALLKVTPSIVSGTLKSFADKGFITFTQRVRSGLAARSPEKAALHNEHNEHNEHILVASTTTPNDLAKLWNELRDPSQPEVRLSGLKAGSPRWKSAAMRLKEQPDLAYWRDVILQIAGSAWCTGENDSGWKADFGFLIRPETHIKALEGKYAKRKTAKKPIEVIPTYTEADLAKLL